MNTLTLSGTSGDRRDGCVGSRFTLAVGSDKGRAGIGCVAGLISASDGAFRLMARLLRLVVRRMLSHGRRSTWHAVTLVPSARRHHSTCTSIVAPARPLPAGEQTKLRGSGGLPQLLGRTSSARVLSACPFDCSADRSAHMAQLDRGVARRGCRAILHVRRCYPVIRAEHLAVHQHSHVGVTPSPPSSATRAGGGRESCACWQGEQRYPALAHPGGLR